MECSLEFLLTLNEKQIFTRVCSIKFYKNPPVLRLIRGKLKIFIQKCIELILYRCCKRNAIRIIFRSYKHQITQKSNYVPNQILEFTSKAETRWIAYARGAFVSSVVCRRPSIRLACSPIAQLKQKRRNGV